MKLTVLGSYGTFPGRDGACSGYLLQDEGTNILLDCGNGTIGRLQRYIRIEDIDAVILSHFHLDHTADVFTLKYALETKIEKGQKIGKKMLICPAGGSETARELTDGSVFDVTNINRDLELRIGSLAVSFMKMKHLIETYAVIVKNRRAKFVYSGDTGYCGGIVEASKGADLFLCESTISDESENDPRTDHHLSAGAAGRIASAANVRKLLLTHFWYEDDRKRCVDQAEVFFGNVDAAEEFASYRIEEFI